MDLPRLPPSLPSATEAHKTTTHSARGRGGMVDAADLKSAWVSQCGFESRRPHQNEKISRHKECANVNCNREDAMKKITGSGAFKPRRRAGLAGLLGATALAAPFSAPALAQNAAEATVDERVIVVTAQRRAEALED